MFANSRRTQDADDPLASTQPRSDGRMGAEDTFEKLPPEHTISSSVSERRPARDFAEQQPDRNKTTREAAPEGGLARSPINCGLQNAGDDQQQPVEHHAARTRRKHQREHAGDDTARSDGTKRLPLDVSALPRACSAAAATEIAIARLLQSWSFHSAQRQRARVACRIAHAGYGAMYRANT